MEFTLMRKIIPVLDIDLDETTSFVQKVLTGYHLEHLPLNSTSKHGDVNRATLKAW